MIGRKKYSVRFEGRVVEGWGMIEIGTGHTTRKAILLRPEYDTFDVMIKPDDPLYPTWLTIAARSNSPVTFQIKNISIKEVSLLINDEIVVESNGGGDIPELLSEDKIDIKSAMELL